MGTQPKPVLTSTAAGAPCLRVHSLEAGELPVELLESSSAEIRRNLDIIQAAAQIDLTVLITGESGTGKEVVARAIHGLSARSRGPFISVNCGALPGDLIESELFGYRRGAFTGAGDSAPGLFRSASGGTFFLDEIAEMPLDAQVKLLRALQQRSVRPVGDTREYPVDLRVIAATNQDLRKAVSEGRFRLDLFYRINVLAIEVPPLRQRICDLPRLVDAFQRRTAHRLKIDSVPKFSPCALRAMAEHDWPGNLRELENVVEVSTVVASGGEIELSHLPAYLRNRAVEMAEPRMEVTTIKQMRQRMVRDVLEHVGFNKSKAARILGISRSRLYAILGEERPD